MKYCHRFRTHILGIIVGLFACSESSRLAQAATFYWDADGSNSGNLVDGSNLGGTGVWNTTLANWWDLSLDVAWPNAAADEAIFTGQLVAGVPTLHTVAVTDGIQANKLTFLRSGYTLVGGGLTLAGSDAGVFVGRGFSATIDSRISGSAGLVLTGGGSLRLTDSTNNYTGVTAINNGVLVIGSQPALGADTSPIVVNGSATRGLGGGSLLLDGSYAQGITFSRDLVLQGYGPITDRNAALISLGNNTLSGAITYAGGNVGTAISSVAGMLTISGNVTSTGTTGLLRFGVVNSVGVGGYHLTGELTIPSTGGIEKTGGGTLILNPSVASYNGVVNIVSGSVRVSDGAALGTSTAGGAITLGGGVGVLEVRTNSPATFSTRRVSMGGTGNATIYLDHAIGSQVLNQTVLFDALTLTAGGTTRTLTIDGRNGNGMTFVGDTVGGAIGGNNNITVNTNGLVTFQGEFWNNTATTARTLTLTTGTGARAVITGSVIASGAAHVLTKAGAGTLTILGNASTYTGATNVNAGVLAISSFGSINNNAGVVNIGTTTTAATLEIVGADLSALQATTSTVINLAGTTGGATILANQTGTSPGLTFNANFTASSAGIKTLTLGGANTANNILNGAIVDSSAATSVVKTGAGTWVLAGANTYTGVTTLNNGTLKLQASLAGTNILPDAALVRFGVGAAGTAGGIFEYVGAAGVASTETIGGLLFGAGAATVKVTPGAGGTAGLRIAAIAESASATLSAAPAATATLTVVSTAGLEPGMRLMNGSAAAYIVSIASATSVVVSANQTLANSTVLNFTSGGTVNYAPEAGGSITLGSVPAVGMLNSYSYFNGADFAYAPATTNAVLRAPVYDTDAGFVTAGAALTANSHNLVNASTSTGAATVLSLKIDGAASPVLTQTGLLTVRTGAAGTAGGILVTGGTATINGAAGVTTGGAADLVIRVNGASDTLFLNAPVTATTTGGLVKTGAGTLVIGGLNAQTTGGLTQLLEGTIQLATGGRLSANSVNFYMRQNTVFDLNGVNVSQSTTTSSIGIFNGAGTVTNTSANPVIFAIAGSGGVFNGSINEVNGKISVVKMGTTSTQVFNGLSNYTGSTTIGFPGNGTTGTLSVFYLADIGVESSIGRGEIHNNAGSLIFGGTTGGLVYTGDVSVSTNRLFTLAGTVAGAGATITNNGVNNAALIFSNTDPFAFNTSTDQLLRLGGTSLADNWFHPQITNNGGAITSFTKVNAGLWILGNANNNYTGVTTITEGALQAQDGSTLPKDSGLILGGGATTAQSVFQSSGLFTRSLGSGPDTVAWGTGLTTGGSGFAASTSKLVVAIGGLGTETQLVWNTTGFLPTGTGTGTALVLNSTTALAEVELRNSIDLNGANRIIAVNENTSTFTDYATITGAITNSTGLAGITKTGNGTLQLRGANTYNGPTAVTAGTLIVTSLGHSTDAANTPTSIGVSGVPFDNSNALTLGNAGTGPGILQYIGTGEVSDRLIRLNTTTGSTQIHADGSGPLILTNLLNNMMGGVKTLFLRGSNSMGNMITSSLADNGGALSVTVDGGATWILSGSNSHTGATSVNAGALGIGSDTALGTGNLSLNAGSVFAHGGDRTLTNTVTISTNAPTAFIGTQSLTLAPSDGIFTVTGTTSSLGVTTTNSISSDKTLTLDGDFISVATAARTWAINGVGNTVFTGDIVTTGASTVALSYTGTGSLFLGGSNTTGGATTINGTAGRVIIATDNAFGTGALALTAGSLESAGGSRTIASNVTHGGTFIIGGSDKITFNGTWLNSGSNRTLTVNSAGGVELAGQVNLSEHATTARTLTINGPGDVLISGLISNGVGSGASALSYTGTGTLTLTNGGNTYTGTTTLNSATGTLVVGSNTALNGTLALTAGTLRSNGTDRVISSNVTHGGTVIIGGDDKITFNGTWLNNGGSRTLTVNSVGGVELAGQVNLSEHATTARILTINGSGDVLISGLISNGVGSGASALSYTGTGTLTLTNGGNTYTGTTTLNSATGTLRLTGAGKLGTGPLTVNAGSLLIQSVNQSVGLLTMGNVAAASSSINIGSGLTLAPNGITYAGTTALPATITGAGTLDLGGAGITVTVADNATQAADMIWSVGTLTGSGTFVKAGAGTLDISGITTNSFTGSFQITAGAILGLNSFANNLALNGGVYQGSGTFTRGLGTGDNQVQWLSGGGGFTAVGGDLSVTLFSAPSPLVWGSTASFVPDNAPLIFGSSAADSVTTFTNNINLNGSSRTISVVDNTTVTTDRAVLSGVLSNGAITKTGNGILRLDGANTFTGAITLNAGTLQFSTISGNGGAPSNLGQGANGIILAAGRLQFVGTTNQSTDREIQITSNSVTLDASGIGGATISYGAIYAGGFSLNLDGTGDGFLNGLVTTIVHPTDGAVADLNKSGPGTWTINVAPIIQDNMVISGGTLILNAPNSFDADDLFIRAATLRLGVNGALTNDMDDLNISTETASGGVFDINGTTGSSTTDIIIGTNPINTGTTATLSGSMVDLLGGGSFSTTTMNIRNGLVAADVATSGAVTLGNVIAADHAGLNTTAGIISSQLTLNAGSSLALWNGTISGNIIFGASTVNTTKQSSNTVTLSGNNTVTGGGATTINNGILLLDHGVNTGGKISDGALNLNGGILQIDGHASTPVTVSTGVLTLGTGTDPAPAVVRINTAGAAATLAIGTITRNAGSTLRFNPSTASGRLTTGTSNAAGTILGGWATYQVGNGAAQFATVSGGEILGLTSTVINNVAAWTAGADITDDNTGFFGSLAASLSINSLRFDAASGLSTVTIGASDVLNIASGGLLITNNVSAGNPSITGGRITAGALNELIITQDGAAPFTLASRLGTTTLALTKTGSGVLIVNQTDNNGLTGTVRVGAGVLRLQGGGAIGDRSTVYLEPVNGVVLDVVDSETIGSLAGGDASNSRGMEVQIAAGKVLTINQTGNQTFYGHINAIAGSATLTKTGTGTLTITDGLINLGPAGVVNVEAGRLTLDVNGNNHFIQNIIAGTTVNIGTGASLYVNHNDVSTATGVLGGRIADNVVFNLNSTGSTTDGLYYSSNQNIGVTEVIGALNFVSGVNSVRVDATTTSGNTSQNTVLRATSITRSNQATLVLRGTGIQATSNPRAQFQSTALMPGFGTGTTTSLPVIPWAIGPAAGGAAAADSFLTTAGTANAGWRPLNLATEYAIVTDVNSWSAATSTNNVLVNTTTNGAEGKTIRSLLVAMGTGNTNLTGSDVLTVESGGFLFSGTGASTVSGFTGIAISPTLNEYIFHVVGGIATISPQLTTPAAKLTKSGAGILVLSASNLSLGDITLNEGLVQISDLDNIGGSTGDIYFAGGGLRLDATAYSGDDLSTRTFRLLPGGGTVDTNGNNISFANAIGAGSTGDFTKAGAGVLTLNAQVAYTGGTVISGGTLLYGIPEALPASMKVTLAGGTLDVGSYATTLQGMTLAGNSALAGSAPVTISGDLQVDGAAARTLTVNNSALTTFSGGTVYLVNNGTTARTTTINGTGNILISSEITNGTAAGSLTYSGSGTLTLTGANTYTGLTTLNNTAGTLVFSGDSQFSGQALTVNAGTLQLNPAFDQTIGNLIMGGGAGGSSATLQIGAGRTLTLAGTVTFSSSSNNLAATITGGAGAILDFGGVARTFIVGDSTNAEPDMIIGANVTLQNDGGGGIIKQGPGTLHIDGTNNLTGPVFIEAGAVTGNLGTGALILNNGVFEGSGTFTRSWHCRRPGALGRWRGRWFRC